MMQGLFASLLVLVVAGCAAYIRTEGVSGPVAWRATDLALSKRIIDGRERDVYSFALVLKETKGIGITFTRLERTYYEPTIHGTPVVQSGRWILRPNGELRVPFSSYIYCPQWADICHKPGVTAPLWNVILTGTDDRGQPVRLVIDVALPPDPATTPIAITRAPLPTPSPSVSPPPPPTAMAPVASAPAKPISSTVPIQIIEKLVLAPATLNGSQGATLLVDTGASVTVISPAVAQRLGISPGSDASVRSIQLPGGHELKVPLVRLRSIEVGSAGIQDLEVGVYNLYPDAAAIMDGVLGGDFLGRFRMTVDHAARQLRLESGR